MSPPPDARARLAADRVATLSRLARLEREQAGIVAAAQSANGDDEHDPEGATVSYERAQLAALLTQTNSHLADADAALQRLSRHRYGLCEECGTPITAERLAALPAARLCIACAAQTRHRPQR
ncbi:MAG: TraR/DksA family transcriptional regulator [Actinomycetota bacterium]|nr:TraR/DksA family transcriptional regulator [Actinomycetota bacterium]